MHSMETRVNHIVLHICQLQSSHRKKKKTCVVTDLTKFTVVILLQYTEY